MDKNKLRIKEYDGITLVALVITVIILLILAGVAITAIIGEEGIFNKAKYSSEKYNNAAKNEADRLNELLVDRDNTSEPKIEEPVSNGGFAISKGVNTPDTSKFPAVTTKYVTWTDTYIEQLSETVPENWYDYNNSKWANIKTTSTDGSLEAYWVWIPRFAYKLPENSNAKTIEVAFAKGNGTTVINPATGVDEQAYYATDAAITTDGSGLYAKKAPGAESKWIIHPAFTFGNNSNLSDASNVQVNGIWVAKYEASSSSPGVTYGGGDNTGLKVQVKPSVASWRGITTANSLVVCRAIKNAGGVLGIVSGTSDLDTHLIKNIEWAAVGCLSQSKYGNFNRATNTNMQVWNNPSDGYRTGKAGSTKDQGSTGDGSCVAYNTTLGIQASTTGNIYGIYDMAGGSWEQVAGILNGYASSLGASIEKKYYDLYVNSGNVYSNYTGGKIGDLTAELLPVGTSEISWNSDKAQFITTSYPLFYRGGFYESATGAGVFAYSCSSVSANSYGAFRPTLAVL